jgi:DNA replication and repair protein RecF
LKKVEVGKIVLNNFRSYSSFKEDFSDCKNVVIYGKNGVGKTNILEAVSFLSIGSGVRKSKFIDVGNVNFEKKSDSDSDSWTVFSEIDFDGDTVKIGTSYPYLGSKKSKGRIFSVDGSKLSVHSDILDYVRVVSLVPWMDRIFQDSSSDRRKFFDGFIEQFYRFHNSLLVDYNNMMKQRTKLLKKKKWDKDLILILERGMVEKAIAIAANRISYVAKINKLLESVDGLPSVKIVLNGLVENYLEDNSAADAEDMFLEKLLKNRDEFRDSYSPFVPGIHRTDFSAFNLDKNISVDLTSTGEQKLVVVSIVLKNIDLIKLNFDVCPVVLIDEAVAHLDSEKKKYFFEMLQSSDCQCFYTGVSKEFFEDLDTKKTKFLYLV